ncbi:MAG: glycosyltransferase, partial [Chloroflexota bacterium]
DRWKDPHGVVDAFELAAKEVDATLVLLGNIPADDPDDNPLITSLLARRSERIKVLTVTDYPLVGALQQHATVVLQKSLREGFGLTVSEALWKGTPVIGGNAGGIPGQIDHGENGYLVNSVDEAAGYIVDLVSNPKKAKEMGEQGVEKVRQNFLITRLLEDHFDLLTSFEATYTPSL